MNNKFFYLILSCAFMLGCISSMSGHGSTVREGSFDYIKARNTLVRMFREKGSKAAYEYFKVTYKNVDAGTIHGLEHILGQEIYSREGLQGILICQDGQFYGCYHGFIGKALSREGSGIIKKIEAICDTASGDVRDYNGCFHGVGHGLMGYQGYTDAGLMAALRGCDDITKDTAKRECYGGVLMEFNTQSMIEDHPKDQVIRPYSPSDPFSPCPKLPLRYQSACYFEQPGWWRLVFNDDFVKIGALCNELRDTEFRKSCFSGLGQLATGVKRFQKESVLSTCEQMPSADGKTFCRDKALEQLTLYSKSAADNRVFDYGKAQVILKDMFRTKGESETYSYFVSTYASQEKDAHNLSHWMGEQLYKRRGIDGIALCDSSFTYGCYHGFFSAAVYREGIQLLARAESACKKIGSDVFLFTGCLHGIGHGVLANAGSYTVPHLQTALINCDLLSAPIAKTSCYNGVFMEYNDRTMESVQTGGSSLRPLTSGNPLSPCDELSVQYQSDCYYEQPSWWEHVFSGGDAAMVQLCYGLSRVNGEACARGLGRMLVTERKADTAGIKTFCQKGSSYTVLYCMIGAVEQLINEHDKNPTALCSDLSNADKQFCIDRSKAVSCATTSMCE